ncbi:hypothetical protein CFP56_014483 [Quercus suber]|uniref:Reverse transcriptase zinc-binding domain-containing protein n=1 Tax=Quercus suber TaxID=58331 RepID=A0AAW0M5M6_QUESU
MTHGFPQFHPSPQPPITLLPDQQLVSDIIVPKTRQWNRALLHNLFDHDTASSIQQIHIPFTPVADSTIWAKCPSGKFSVKSAYLADQNAKFTNSGPLIAVEWKKLWSMKFNERPKYHIWNIAWDVIPTREFLARRIARLDSSCPRCHHPQESVVHALFEYPFAIIVWRHTSIPVNPSSIPPKSAFELTWIDNGVSTSISLDHGLASYSRTNITQVALDLTFSTSYSLRHSPQDIKVEAFLYGNIIITISSVQDRSLLHQLTFQTYSCKRALTACQVFHFNDQKVLKGKLAQVTSKHYNNITCELNSKNRFQFSQMSHILNLTKQLSLHLPEENIITKMLHKQHKRGKSIRADIDAINRG